MSPPRPRQARIEVLAALALLLLVPGCPERRARPDKQQALVVHMEAEPPLLVNMIQPDFWAKHITTHNIFESLIRMDPRTYRFEGELASTWKVSKDRLTYTFYLRGGVRWHDGRLFSGRDVRFTFDRLMDESVRAASTRATLGPFIESYRLVKPDIFEIVCRKASPFFLASLSDLDILPAHLLGTGEMNTHPFLRRPTGTGPYRFVSWRTGQQIVLSRFDRYWGRRPAIPRVIYRLVSSPEVAIRLARRRELDFVPRVRAAQWTGVVLRDPVFQHEFIRTRHFPPGVSYIVLNHMRPLFADVRVRRALAKLLDLDTILGKIMHGLGRRIGALYWFSDPDYNDRIPPVRYDPEGARKLLAQAGFSDSDGNGVLDRDGEPFRFTFLRVTVSQTQKRWLTLYQQALRQAGIVMEIVPIDWSAYMERVRRHDFDAGALGMRQMGPFTDLYLQFHSSQIEDGQNYGALRNAEVDRLLEQIRSEMDPARRRAMSLKVQRILADQVAVIPLYADEEPGIVSRRVHGVYTSALWYQIRDWWMD